MSNKVCLAIYHTCFPSNNLDDLPFQKCPGTASVNNSDECKQLIHVPITQEKTNKKTIRFETYSDKYYVHYRVHNTTFTIQLF